MTTTILVVDDEPDLAQAMQTVLATHLHGDRILCAESPEAAMGILRRERIDLLITDQRMPGKSGTELLAEAERLQPGVAGVLVTAWGWDTIRGLGADASRWSILQKPFPVGVLVEEARIALANRAPPLLLA